MTRGQNYRGKERAKTSLKSLEASQRSTLTTSTRLASAGSSSLATTSWYDITNKEHRLNAKIYADILPVNLGDLGTAL